MSVSENNEVGDNVKEAPGAEKPAPPKPPAVELFVEGFGFMPQKHTPRESGSKDSVRDSCASSSNIDIVRKYTWKTKNRMTVQVITYGATIISIQVPDKKGVPTDVLAGFDTLEEYFQPRNPYFGGTIGRYTNYIRDATIQVKPSGRTYMLSTNKGPHHYHGGHVGFDKVNWRSYVSGNKVIMSHVSERFSEGYPGTVMAQVAFEVTCENTIKIEMKCTTNEPTIVNMSNAAYFNLAGHESGNISMYEHIFTINADKYTPAGEDGVVLGEKKVVGGTPFDFRVPRILKSMIPLVPMGGYDVNYCITQATEQDLTFQARVLHPASGRVVEVYSNQPGLQFYTGNHLPDPDAIFEDLIGEDEDLSGEESDEENEEKGESEGVKKYGYVPLTGKGGMTYRKHGLFCLMPQNYPDAINHKTFPNSILNPGEVYIHKMQYKFGLLLGKFL